MAQIFMGYRNFFVGYFRYSQQSPQLIGQHLHGTHGTEMAPGSLADYQGQQAPGYRYHQIAGNENEAQFIPEGVGAEDGRSLDNLPGNVEPKKNQEQGCEGLGLDKFWYSTVLADSHQQRIKEAPVGAEVAAPIAPLKKRQGGQG
jgi:hypothetical protein